jgi:hypothetical protein
MSAEVDGAIHDAAGRQLSLRSQVFFATASISLGTL